MPTGASPEGPEPDRRLTADDSLRTFDLLLEGLQIIGRDWRYLYLNEAVARHARRPAGALVGLTMMEAFPGIETTPLFRVLERCMSERSAARFENEFLFPEGGSAWFELHVRPVAEGLLVLSIDVTERHLSEERLRDSERRFELLVESVPEALFVQTGGRFAYLNPAAIRLFGASGAGELAGRPVLDRFSPEEREIVRDRIRILNEERAPVEHVAETVLRLNGERVAVEVSAVPIRYQGEDGALVFMRDVTAERRQEEERRKLEEQFRQAQKMEAIGRFAATIAHDFNNVLTVVLAGCDLGLARVHEDDPLHADLAEIRGATEVAAQLSRQLLAFGRRQVLEVRTLSLNEVLERMEPLLRRLVGEDVDLQLRLDPELGAVRADPGLIEQVVMNLVVNARDAMPRGGRISLATADVELDDEYARHHPTTRPGPHVMLSISDTGTGMDAATRERLFEPFFTTKVAGRGTGLGLAAVYGIVKQSGGNIWVYSEPGQGSTFKVYLPRDAAARPERLPVRAETPAVGGSETVLVVEDEPPLRRLIERILRGAGYHVLVAADGAEALALAQSGPEPPQLLLSDLVLPGMGGEELARRASALHPGIRLLFMSGYAEDVVLHQGLLDGSARFLGKPFSTAQLLTRVREALDG